MSQRQQVSIQEATQAGINAIEKYYPNKRASFRDIKIKYNNRGESVLFEVLTDSMCVLLSGSKSCQPILGFYAFKPELSIIGNYNNLPCTLRSMIDDYISQIDSCIQIDSLSLYHINDWDSLINYSENNRFQTVVSIVGPLISTQWGQDSDYTKTDPFAYNYRIVGGDNCSHCKTGCGATATAQVMNYWHYPIFRTDYSEQFNWCIMPAALNYNSTDYVNERNAVSFLMKKTGEAMSSNYGCTATSSDEDDTRDALVEVFNYSSDAHVSRRQDYSYTNWISKIKNHIDWGYPVLYMGTGSGGHIFICDGYNSSGLFHFNWGWDGDYDGFFSLDNLTPGNHYYPLAQKAIFYIHPNGYNDICYANIGLEDFYNNYYSYHIHGYSSNTPSLFLIPKPYQITPNTMTILTSAPSTTRLDYRTIPAGVTAEYQAHEEIILQDGFEALSGSEFTACIKPCSRCGSTQLNTSITSPINIYSDNNIVQVKSVPNTTTFEKEGIYPNPTDGKVTVSTDGEVEAIVIYTLDGRPVGGWKFISLSDSQATLDVSSLADGIYLLTVRTKNGTTVKKLTVAR